MLQENEAQKDTDIEIVKRVQNGDKQAYNILVIKYQHRIVSVIEKMSISANDALDVAQETFIRAYNAIDSFREDSSFYTWLYRIAINCAKTYLEKNSKYKMHVDVDDPDFHESSAHGALTSIETPDKLIETDELQRVILQAIDELPSELKETLILREIENLSYDEISLRTNVPTGTVKSRIFRARQFVEEKMSSFGFV